MGKERVAQIASEAEVVRSMPFGRINSTHEADSGRKTAVIDKRSGRTIRMKI